MICDFSGFHHRPSFDTLNHSIFVKSEKCGGWEGRPESWKKGFFIRYVCCWSSNSHRKSFRRPFTVHFIHETSNTLDQSRQSLHAEKLIHFKVKNLLKSRKSSPMFSALDGKCYDYDDEPEHGRRERGTTTRKDLIKFHPFERLNMLGENLCAGWSSDHVWNFLMNIFEIISQIHQW